MVVATSPHTVSLTIDGRPISAAAGDTVLQAALAAGIDVPRLCFDPRLRPVGACRLCLVEVEGQPNASAACTTAVSEGMVVQTESDELASLRKEVLELILGNHRVSCPTCDKNGDCALMDYAYRYRADQFAFGSYQPDPVVPNFATGNEAISFDPQLCIACGRCVRICDEVVMASALTFAERASQVAVTTPFEMALNDTSCVLCGMCISTCPTGALYERAALGQGQAKDLESVRTVCPYCGVGCVLELNVNRQTNRVVRVTSPVGAVPNDGNLCVKGKFGFEFVHSPERLTTPLIKDNGEFREASWEEALELTGRRLRELRQEHGPDGIGFLSSCRCTNEENYLLQKVARTAGATNNIDQCATTCHAPSVAGLATSFGSGAMTNSIGEIKDVDTMFIIGSNPTEAHPIIGLEMKKARRRGARMIVCDPRRTWVAEHADIHIQHKPGTDNMLINAMMRHILDQGLHDREFIASRCENFEAFQANLEGFSVEEAAEVCDVDADLIRRAAEMYARGTPSGIYYTLGITEHTSGTENVMNLANLAMLTGQIGKPSSGVNPLRGQNNVQGSCDMGSFPHELPGYRPVTDDAVRASFDEHWGVSIHDQPGFRIPNMLDAAVAGEFKGIYIQGEDIAQSDPNTQHVEAALEAMDCVIVQDLFLNETAKFAHVFLPGTSFLEKDGTFINAERRINRVRPVTRPLTGMAEWEVTQALANALGYPMHYDSASQIMDEIAELTPTFAGVSFDFLDEHGSVQWPCNAAAPEGTPIMHVDEFVRGKGMFILTDYQPTEERANRRFPLLLTTGRVLSQYNVGAQTRRTENIQWLEQDVLEIHPADAELRGVHEGDLVAVASRMGEITLPAHISERVAPGVVYTTFHHPDTGTNVVTTELSDWATNCPEYKVTAVEVRPANHRSTWQEGFVARAAEQARLLPVLD
jgi:formate dehydrogenase alpha subunit